MKIFNRYSSPSKRVTYFSWSSANQIRELRVKSLLTLILLSYMVQSGILKENPINSDLNSYSENIGTRQVLKYTSITVVSKLFVRYVLQNHESSSNPNRQDLLLAKSTLNDEKRANIENSEEDLVNEDFQSESIKFLIDYLIGNVIKDEPDLSKELDEFDYDNQSNENKVFSNSKNITQQNLDQFYKVKNQESLQNSKLSRNQKSHLFEKQIQIINDNPAIQDFQIDSNQYILDGDRENENIQRQLQQISDPILINGTGQTFKDTLFQKSQTNTLDYMISVDINSWTPYSGILFQNCTFNITGNFLFSSLPIKLTFVNCTFYLQNTISLIVVDYATNSSNFNCFTDTATGDISIRDSTFTDNPYSSQITNIVSSSQTYLLKVSSRYDIVISNTFFQNMFQNHVIQISDIHCTNVLPRPQYITFSGVTINNSNLEFSFNLNNLLNQQNQMIISLSSSTFQNIQASSPLLLLTQTVFSPQILSLSSLQFINVSSSLPLLQASLNQSTVQISQITVVNCSISQFLDFNGSDSLIISKYLIFKNLANISSVSEQSKALLNIQNVRNKLEIQSLQIFNYSLVQSPVLIGTNISDVSLANVTIQNVQLNQTDLIKFTTVQKVVINSLTLKQILVTSALDQNSAVTLSNFTLNQSVSSYSMSGLSLLDSQILLLKASTYFLLNASDTSFYNISLSQCSFSNNVYQNQNLLSLASLGATYFNLNNQNCISSGLSQVCSSTSQYFDQIMQSCQACPTGCSTCSSQRLCTTCSNSQMSLSSSDGLCYCPKKQYLSDSGTSCQCKPFCKLSLDIECADKCLTCSNSYECLTYDYCPNRFQTLSSDKKCTFKCQTGFFIDSQTCGSCTDPNCRLCSMRNGTQECASCQNGYYLDLRTYTCVSSCPVLSKTIETLNSVSQTGTLVKYCRPYQEATPYLYHFWVNGSSDSLFSMGTKEYPYINIVTAAKEILNFMTESQTQIVYNIARNNTYRIHHLISPIVVLKVQNISFNAYGDPNLPNPLINFISLSYFYPDSLAYGISENNYNFTKRIALGDISTTDSSSSLYRFVFRSSNVTFIGIDFQSLMLGDQLSNSVFRVLQSVNKSITFDNCYFDTDGKVWDAYYQVQIWIQNSVINVTNIYNGFWIEVSFDCSATMGAWSDLVIQNSRVVGRYQKATSNFLYYYGYGNFIIRNNSFENCSFINQDTRPFFSVNPSTQCNPYNLIQNVVFANNKFQNLTESNLVISWAFSAVQNSTRQFFFENNTIIGTTLNKNLLVATVTNSSIISIKNNSFINSKIPNGYYMAVVTADTSTINFINNSIINSTIDDYAYFVGGNYIIVQNLLVSGVLGTGSITTTSAIVRASRSNLGLVISNLTLMNSQFLYGMAVSVETARSIMVRDSVFSNNSIFQSDLIALNQLQRVNVQNISVVGLNKSSDAAKYIISIPYLNLSSGFSNYNVRNMTLSNIQSSFMIIKSQTANGLNSEAFTFNVSDLTFHDNSLTNRDNIIYLGTISYRLLNVYFSNLNFMNTTLVNGKFFTVLSNMQQISMKNAVFQNNSGQILYLKPSNLDQAASLSFQVSNCSFVGNYAGSDAAIQVASNTILRVGNSTFLENYSGGRGSVIFGDYQAAQIYITDCLFKNNYAYQGGVFYMSYSSTLEVTNSRIFENFAVTGGVGYINNNGIIAISGNSVIANNQGLNTCMFFVINSQVASYLDNVQIYQNDQNNPIIPKSIFLSTNENYVFIRKEFFNIMQQISSKVQRTIKETSDFAIQVISASFNISSSNITANDQILSASTNSIVGIDDSTISSIQASGQLFQSIQSSLLIQNLTLWNITHKANVFFFLFRAESLSILQITSSSLSNITSMLMYVSESELSMTKSSIVNITSDSSSYSIFSMDQSSLVFDHLIFENISSYYISSIFNLQTNDITMNNTQVSRFDKNFFLMAGGSLLVANFSAFSFKRNLNKQSNYQFISNSLVFAVTNANFTIQDSTIKGIATNYSSPAIYHALSDQETSQYLLKINNCNFLNNFARQSAGAIQTVNSNLLVNNSIFDNNTAYLQKAGAIQMSCLESQLKRCSYVIDNTAFTNNIAQTQGGALSYDYYEPVIYENTKFTNNTATYGADIASYAAYLKELTINSTDNITTISPLEAYATLGLKNATVLVIVEDQISGQLISQGVSLVLQDNKGSVISSDNSSQARVDAVDQLKVQVLKSRVVDAVQGVYTFDDFILVAQPGTDIFLEITSDAIDKQKILNAYSDITSLSDLYLKVHLRLCKKGEYQSKDLKCIQCSDGLYQLLDNQTECNECPDNAQCQNGYEIIPNDGYWRPNENSTQIFECLNSDACLSKYEDQCSPGYGGNLCQSCVKYEDDWYSLSDSYTCSKCPNYVQNLWKLIGVTLLILIYFIALVIINIRTAGKQKLTTVYLRILTNYFQILTLAQSYDLSWETVLQQFLQYISIVARASEFIVSQNCFYRESGFQIHPQYIKMILALVVPLLILLLIAFILLCKYKCETGIQLKSNLVVAVIVMIFIAMPSITSISFSILNCKDIFGNDQGFLLSDLSIQCWKQDHSFYAYYIAVPIILVWVLFVPLLALFVLTKNRIALKESQNITRYGFLYVGLKHESFYWEILIHFRKVAMICINVFFSSFIAEYRALIGFIILIIYIELLQKVKPYQTERINDLELYSNLAAFSVFYGGLFFISNQLPLLVVYFFVFIILMINLIFWVKWFKLLFEELYDKAKTLVKKYLCSFLAKHFKYLEGKAKQNSKLDASLEMESDSGSPKNIQNLQISQEVISNGSSIRKEERFAAQGNTIANTFASSFRASYQDAQRNMMINNPQQLEQLRQQQKTSLNQQNFNDFSRLDKSNPFERKKHSQDTTHNELLRLQNMAGKLNQKNYTATTLLKNDTSDIEFSKDIIVIKTKAKKQKRQEKFKTINKMSPARQKNEGSTKNDKIKPRQIILKNRDDKIEIQDSNNTRFNNFLQDASRQSQIQNFIQFESSRQKHMPYEEKSKHISLDSEWKEDQVSSLKKPINFKGDHLAENDSDTSQVLDQRNFIPKKSQKIKVMKHGMKHIQSNFDESNQMSLNQEDDTKHSPQVQKIQRMSPQIASAFLPSNSYFMKDIVFQKKQNKRPQNLSLQAKLRSPDSESKDYNTDVVPSRDSKNQKIKKKMRQRAQEIQKDAEETVYKNLDTSQIFQNQATERDVITNQYQSQNPFKMITDLALKQNETAEVNKILNQSPIPREKGANNHVIQQRL